MRSFSLLDTYDPSANSTRYPYKESILIDLTGQGLCASGEGAEDEGDGALRLLTVPP